MDEADVGEIARTYRAWNPAIRSVTAWRVFAWAWGLFAVVQLVQAVRAFVDGREWGVVVYSAAFVLFSLTASLGWSNRTEISPEGVRVNRWFRWRTLPWDRVASLVESGRGGRSAKIAVLTSAGERVALDVPTSLRGEFVVYAKRHGAPLT